jgi:hypothetical protein
MDDLAYLDSQLTADYYADNRLLIFPAYTRPTCMNAHGNPNAIFWDTVKSILATSNVVREVILEHPYLSEEEGDAVAMIQELHPGQEPSWYYAPVVVSRADEISKSMEQVSVAP